jgi:HlyD family secretion protein
MKRNTKLAFTALFAVAANGAGLESCGWFRKVPTDRISLSGNIELTQVNIAFKVSGKLAELPIDEGVEVRKGSVVGRLDAVQLQRQRSRDRASLTLAETQLTQQETAIEYQRAALAADVEVCQAALRQAEARLDQLLAGSRKQEIEQARAAAEEARSQQALAREDWTRAQTLYKNDDISASQYDQFRTRSDAASAALKRAEEQLALVIEGPRKEDIAAARAQVEQARASLRLAEAARLDLKRREQELESRHAQIEQAKAQLGMTDAQLDDTVALSPVNGVVLVKSAEAGEILAAGTTIATIGEMEKPWLRGYINERDLGRVKLGAKVKVTTDSAPGKIYWGRVSFISSEAEFTPKQIQTTEERVKLVYRIKVEVDNPNHELKLNMPADAEIQIGS